MKREYVDLEVPRFTDFRRPHFQNSKFNDNFTGSFDIFCSYQNIYKSNIHKTKSKYLMLLHFIAGIYRPTYQTWRTSKMNIPMYSSIWSQVDLWCRQGKVTLWKNTRHARKPSTETKTPGGTKGFSLKPKAVSKYYLVAEYRSIFMRNLKDMLQLNTSSCLHNDLQKSRISRDESDVKSLLSTLDSWINPFEIEQQDLVCLSTGKVATEQIEKDLLQAQDIGERAVASASKG